MKPVKIPDVKTVQGTPLPRRIFQVILIVACNHARLQRRSHVHTPPTQCSHQVLIHGVFVNIQAYSHEALRDRKCSRSIRSTSTSSAAISASISSRLAW